MDRRTRTLWRLLGNDSDAVLLTSPENVRYVSGFSGSEGTLLLTRGTPFFFTDGRYVTQARQQVRGCKRIIFKDKWQEIGNRVRRLGITTLAFESRHLTVAMLRELEKHAEGIVLKPCGQELDPLRIIKESRESALLREAARIAACGLQDALTMLRPGVREQDAAAELEYRMRLHGAQGAAFPTIVASGARSALPHGTASRKMVRRGELVTIDYGAVYEGYCSDETCTFVIGKPSARQRKVYETVLRAHDRALRMVRPGRDLKTIDAAARSVIEKAGYGKYFNHGTGHGLGLCVHEPPVVSSRATMTARRGMVFTIEPGVYIPGWGGVRIEDTVLVTTGGCEVLTRRDKRLQCLG